MGEMERVDGRVVLGAGMTEGWGYMPQEAWLQRGTVRENVVWSGEWDGGRYAEVLHASSIEEDLKVRGDVVDMVWCGVVWCGVAGCGVVWYSVV